MANKKLVADSSHPIKALFPVEPRSINIPQSLVLASVNPLFNSIKLSLTVMFVVDIVVVSPTTLKSPLIVTVPVTVVVPAPSTLNLDVLPLFLISNNVVVSVFPRVNIMSPAA